MPILLSGVYATCVAGSVVSWGSGRLALVMSDFALGAATAAAAAACHRQGRNRHRSQRAWMLFTLSFTMATFGHCLSGWYTVMASGSTGSHDFTRLIFLLFVPPAASGLLLLTRWPTSKAGWVCMTIDVWLLGSSLFTLFWTLSPTDATQHTAVSLTGALLEIALVSTAMVMHRRATGADRRPGLATVTALALIAAGDLLLPVHLRGVAWVGGSLLVVRALRGPWRPVTSDAPGRLRSPRISGHPHNDSLQALAPYLGAATCTLGILATVIDGRRVDSVVVLVSCSVVMMLVLRQGIMLLDNIALAQKLAQKEQHFRSLVQSSSDVIMVTAPSGVLRYVSPAARAVYGRNAEDLIGCELATLVHPEDLGALLHEARRFLAASPADEPTTLLDYRFRSGDGRWLDVESTVNRHQGGLIFNSRDVTGRSRIPSRFGRHAGPSTPFPSLGLPPPESQERASTVRPPRADATHEVPIPMRHGERKSGPGEPADRVLQLGALLLPAAERAEWLEEQAGYLADLPRLSDRWKWILNQLFAMPRYAYTVRSGREKEPA
ncbi:PAS domain S-box protein [Streptomyces sp. TLI_105]|uniref:PAS domain-containing protein n=1 Tax=Streptomyces sp. TLI_105 TaxID=1881019 RepID=UPI00115FC95C|nr:PAS domain S-box protein [Streptomyces sp. TLI_105]